MFVRIQCLTVIDLYIYYVFLYVKCNVLDLVLREYVHNHNTKNRKCTDILFQRLYQTHSSNLLIGNRNTNVQPLAIRIKNLPWNVFFKLYSFLVSNLQLMIFTCSQFNLCIFLIYIISLSAVILRLSLLIIFSFPLKMHFSCLEF